MILTISSRRILVLEFIALRIEMVVMGIDTRDDKASCVSVCFRLERADNLESPCGTWTRKMLLYVRKYPVANVSGLTIIVSSLLTGRSHEGRTTLLTGEAKQEISGKG